jgi:hypothetical protein
MRWVEWVEPFGPNNEPVYMRVADKTAIAVMKSLHKYESDEKAFEDFVTVHWASVREEQENLTVFGLLR